MVAAMIAVNQLIQIKVIKIRKIKKTATKKMVIRLTKATTAAISQTNIMIKLTKATSRLTVKKKLKKVKSLPKKVAINLHQKKMQEINHQLVVMVKNQLLHRQHRTVL